MENGKKPNVHIGYYLKTLDNILTQTMDSIHITNGITRAEWQILNSINEKPKIEKIILIDTTKEFTDLSTAHKLIEELTNKGLISGTNNLELTAKGQKTYANSFKMQKEFRKKAMRGVTEADYDKVIGTLNNMIINLKDIHANQ